MDETGNPPAAGSELITVRVGEQLFALDIMTVREIRGWSPSTPVPHGPDHVLGMINLRGVVLPVIDLAARLGLPRREPDNTSVVVVADLDGRPVGLMVDAVCDILTVSAGQVQAAPELGGHAGLVSGVIPDGEQITTVLDLTNALPSTDALVLT
jgi:purine-binding chemotaxis protein CheW